LTERLPGLIAELGRSGRLELRRGAIDPSIFTWQDLDRALVRSPDAWRRVDSRGRQQLSLAVESALIPAALVLDDRGAWGGLSVSLERVRRSLDNGATLMINDVHALCPTLAFVAQQASTQTSARVTMRGFASTSASPGFRPHIDLTDTIVAQTEGRKSWTVWARRGPRPVKDDVILHSPPTDEPVWRGVLAAGDVLHVPAGWWHSPVGVGEPSLHLSCDVHAVLRWDVLRMGTRQHVPTQGASAGAASDTGASHVVEWADLLELARLGREGTFFQDPADGTFPSPVRVRPAADAAARGTVDRKGAWTPHEIEAALERGGVVRVEHVERFLPSVAEEVRTRARGAMATAALVGRGAGAVMASRAENDLCLRQLEGGAKWRVTDPLGRTGCLHLEPGGEIQMSAGSCLVSPAAATQSLHLEIAREPWEQARLRRLTQLLDSP
jgi:hypothetical protein